MVGSTSDFRWACLRNWSACRACCACGRVWSSNVSKNCRTFSNCERGISTRAARSTRTILTWRLGHLVSQCHMCKTIRAHKSRQLTASPKQSLKKLNLLRRTRVRRNIHLTPRLLTRRKAHDHLRLQRARVDKQIALREARLELQPRTKAKVLQSVQLRRLDRSGRPRARRLVQKLSPEHEDLRGQRHETLSLFWGQIDAGLFKVAPKC